MLRCSKILVHIKLCMFLIKDELKHILNAKQGPMAYMNNAAILGNATLIYSSVDFRISFIEI